jgi:energy-coupling factor transporter ATP-binding protein EcfA2
MTGVRPTMGHHRSTRWWFSTVCGAVAVAMALVALRVGASAPPSVKITGGGSDTPRSYDLVVSAPGASGSANTGGWVTNPADLDTLSGGITLAQYDTIRRLAGVQVAAPLAMVGYVPFTVRQVNVPAHLQPDAPAGSRGRAGRRGAPRRRRYLRPRQRLTQARRDIGMVFQKPNPFPAMSIYDNVVAGLKLTGIKMSRTGKDDLVRECLVKAGLWQESADGCASPAARCPAASSSGCASRAHWRSARGCC